MIETFEPTPGETLTFHSGVRFTEEERDRIKRLAKDYDVTVAALIRQATIWALDRMKQTPEPVTEHR